MDKQTIKAIKYCNLAFLKYCKFWIVYNRTLSSVQPIFLLFCSFRFFVIVRPLQIQTRIVGKPYDLSFTPNPQFDDVASVNDGYQMSYTLADLKPSTEYEVKVSAHSSNGKGDGAIVKQFTLPATAQGKTFQKDNTFSHMNRTIDLYVLTKPVTTFLCNFWLDFACFTVILVCLWLCMRVSFWKYFKKNPLL